MPDYKQGKIYCLRSHQTDEIYIGSTTQTLAQRLGKHRSDYKRYLDGKRNYVTSFKMLEYVDAYIELIEMCPCSCRAELCRREGEIIRENDCVNKQIAGRTNGEWHKDNKERMKCYKKQQYQKNKEMYKKNSERQYEMNREKILKMNKQRVNCECGLTLARSSLRKHRQSQRHFKLMDELRSL